MSEFVLGDYIFTRKRIGKGAFSTIYKGKHRASNKVYAIKEISFDNLEKIRDSIKREFTLMKKLNHKNIIKLHEVFFDNDEKNIYLVIDYYAKGDLAKFLNGKPLKEKYAKKYMRQLIEGLKYLYDRQILHRDLKLQNILVTDDNNIVITDFGFARYTDNENMLNTLCGSPMYMAPEIMLKKKYNNKSDLWSVGIIFYELLFGTTPFRARNMIDLMSSLKKKEVVLPENNLSKNCINLISGLLNKNPDRRINWTDLFSHPWFDTDEILEKENALMDISFSKPLPTLNSGQFKSTILFKHKSIRDSEDLQFNLSLTESDERQKESNESNSSNSNSNYQSEDEDENCDVFMSVTNEFENVDSSNENININISQAVSKPINIERPNKSNSIFHSNKYHIIDSCEYKYMSEPIYKTDIFLNTNLHESREESLGNSFKNILSNSFNFLKMSISYLSRKTI